MLSANITNAARQAVYRRDGWRCALCDSPKYIQIHHLEHRSVGGSDGSHNLITLCSDCHAQIHGAQIYPDITREDMEQAAREYLADYYAPDWNPWKWGAAR